MPLKRRNYVELATSINTVYLFITSELCSKSLGSNNTAILEQLLQNFTTEAAEVLAANNDKFKTPVFVTACFKPAVELE